MTIWTRDELTKIGTAEELENAVLSKSKTLKKSRSTYGVYRNLQYHRSPRPPTRVGDAQYPTNWTRDAQIRQVGERGGVVGLGALLLSSRPEEIHLDNYVDQIEYVAELIGIDGVGLGFDFSKFIYETLPAVEQARLPEIPFMADFTDHSHTHHLTRKLIERGFSDEETEKILYRNFLRILAEFVVRLGEMPLTRQA